MAGRQPGARALIAGLAAVARLAAVSMLAAGTVLALPGGAQAAPASAQAGVTPGLIPAAPTPIVQGIDVSGATGSNPVTNWAAVKAAGMSFTGVEAWEGETISNPFFDAQASGALAAGLRVMPYVFANPEGLNNDGFTGQQQFDRAWAAITAVPGYPYELGSWLPVALDLEKDPVASNHHPECYGKSKSAMIAWIQSFVAEAEAKTGIAPVIYVLPQWWTDCTGNTTQFATDPLWVPDYNATSPALPAGWSGYSFWQSSEGGSVTGVAGQVDLDQMSGITVTAPSLASVAGSPVSSQVGGSGPDEAAEYQPTFQAAGLPPGVSMSPAGLMSGWPSAAGAYEATVTASDGLGSAGTASFTWTVQAAADSGTTGIIRQQAGSGKCLAAPSGQAGGTAVDLATCTGKPNQSWTVVQDGSIRVLGRCLAASGKYVLLYPCDGSIADQWRAGTDGSLVDSRYGTCLNGPSRAVSNGTRPTLARCTPSAAKVSQHWAGPPEPVVSGIAGECLGASGSAAGLTGCGNGSAQGWQVAPNAEITVQPDSCLTAGAAGAAAAGSAVTVTKCANAASQHWALAAAGTIADEIRSPTSGLCVTVPPGTVSTSTVSTSTVPPSTRLILGPCSTALASTWRIG
jgi:GH25 family lysozyme M1 (1,4-beta-N-acetylmuramidase)